MRWKRLRDVEYLFRGSDREGRGRLLGRRSAETERTLEAFLARKVAAEARLSAVREQMDEQARLNVALRLARVPRVVGRILREIDRAGLLDSFTVLGPQALYGYEAAGGLQFLLELLASGDVDLLYDTRKSVAVVAGRMSGEGLLGLLKKADRSFECVRKRGFRAANAGQFMVDLIVPPRSMRDSQPVTFGDDDLVAAEVPGLQWLLNAPKLETFAIDETGWPAPFRIPDPRAFALHKAWLASQPDREPLKRPRDIGQARAVARMVVEHMPHLRFEDAITALHGDDRAMRSMLQI